MVTLFLAKALICFSGTCYPAIIGDNTLPGEYPLTQRYVLTDGYGGDVLKYRQVGKDVYSIHRLWEGNPSQQRRKRLDSGKVSDRIGVSAGCINVDNDVYDKLVDCCSNSTLLIVK